MTDQLSRDVPLRPTEAALLFIDVQNFSATPDGGEWKGMDPAALESECGYYFERLRTVAVPNMQKLAAACRHAGIEVPRLPSLTTSNTETGVALARHSPLVKFAGLPERPRLRAPFPSARSP